MKKGFNLIVSILRPEEKSIVESARAMNLEVKIILVEDIIFKYDMNSQLEYFFLRTPSFFQSLYIADYLSKLTPSAFLLNSFESILLFSQKLSTQNWLIKNKLNPVKSITCFNPKMLEQCYEFLKFPIIIKPNVGGFGKFVHIVNNKTELKQITEYIYAFAPEYNKVFFLQEKVDLKHDIRVLILDKKIIASIERINEVSEIKNLSLGARAKVFNSKIFRDFFEQIAQNLPNGFFGIDVIIDKSGCCYVCDINPVCRFSESQKVLNFSIADLLVENIIKKLERKN